MQMKWCQFNMNRPTHKRMQSRMNEIWRQRSSSHIPGGVIRTIEAVVVEVDAGVIQMGVEVEVVVAEEATKTGAIHTTTSLEIIIQGTTITTEEEEAEVVAITATMVRGVKLIMWQVTWGCIHD